MHGATEVMVGLTISDHGRLIGRCLDCGHVFIGKRHEHEQIVSRIERHEQQCHVVGGLSW